MNKRLVCALLLLVLVSGCAGLGDTPTGIGKQPGTGRGTISNLDPLNNGLYQVWIFGDNTYLYCTMDQILVQKIKDIMGVRGDATVIYTYRDWKVGDPEYDTFDAWGNRISKTCGQFYVGSHGSKLMSVDLVAKPQ